MCTAKYIIFKSDSFISALTKSYLILHYSSTLRIRIKDVVPLNIVFRDLFNINSYHYHIAVSFATKLEYSIMYTIIISVIVGPFCLKLSK